MWATKLLNLDIKTAQEKRVMDLHELDEIRLEAYDNSRIYKERTKAFHDKKIQHKDFKAGDKVLLFNSKLRLFPGKLKSRWSGPFEIKKLTNILRGEHVEFIPSTDTLYESGDEVQRVEVAEAGADPMEKDAVEYRPEQFHFEEYSEP
ncbi:PREDICTED: uncharacterized protein LOC104753471 [Camelina sativa]|uniref:Uncharacterized protein LOC104753471 n=1 Tax=Camelina sativa TaxID=90675 RepID=A0ABM0WP74_CAMSA|nr:PREDICTED: uncharacterized protein LOC104753471 [Camelina sativa]